jgi:hypothetical protein
VLRILLDCKLSIHRATGTVVSMPGDGFDFCKVRSWGAARNSLCEGRRLGRARVQYVGIRDRDGDDSVRIICSVELEVLRDVSLMIIDDC